MSKHQKQRDLYYLYDGELYTNTFPREWATKHLPNSGPKECHYCKYYGSHNGVFIGYCIHCAHHIYYFERGLGLLDEGKEWRPKNPDTLSKDTLLNIQKKSIFETYLKDIPLEQVGNKLIHDSVYKQLTIEKPVLHYEEDEEIHCHMFSVVSARQKEIEEMNQFIEEIGIGPYDHEYSGRARAIQCLEECTGSDN